MSNINNCHNCNWFVPNEKHPTKGVCQRYPTPYKIKEAIYCGEWRQNQSVEADQSSDNGS